jgi:hypothetical protein
MTKLIENVTIIKQTDAAILVEFPEIDEPEWIPQSGVHDDSGVWKEGQEGNLILHDWCAKMKNWEEV